MKLAFITMVWRDYWLLEKWISYNATHVPKNQLYVINHGGDPKIDEIAQGCNVMSIPRDGVPMNFDRLRWDLIGQIAAGLLGFYDRVICTDVDELLLFAGEGSLVGYLAQTKADPSTTATGAIGLNMMPTGGGDAASDQILTRFPDALVSGKYSKPCVVHAPSKFTNGAHGLIGSNYTLDPNLLLAHLHYVTPDYQERMDDRKEIAQVTTAQHLENPQDGIEIRAGYWRNWAKSDNITNMHLKAYDAARDVDVSGGFGAVHTALAQHLVKEGRKRHVVQSEVAKDPMRLRLPLHLQRLA